MALSPCGVKTNAQKRELVVHGSPSFPVACYFDALAVDDVPWHWHDELEAFVVTEGETVVAAGSDRFTIGRGDGVLINAGVLHGAWDTEQTGCRFHSVVFHPRLVGGGMDSVFWQNYLLPMMEDVSFQSICFRQNTPWHAEALNAIERAWQACVQEPSGFEFQVRSALSELIALFAAHRPVARTRPSEKSLRDGWRIKTMLQYIQQHYGEEITTEQIAQSALIGQSECLRCFRSTIGITPIQYVKQFRVQRAAALLSETSKKIVEIGMECGFQEMSYFARTFRQIRGCTPSEYRKRNAAHADNGE